MQLRKTVIASIMAAVMLVGGANAHSIGGNGNTEGRETTTWHVDLQKMRDSIAAGLPVEIPVGDLGPQKVLLDEFSVYREGNKLRPVLDDDGQPLGYEPFPYWSYRGSVAQMPSSNVLITMDDRGLYGHIRALGETTTFKPVDEDHVLASGEPAEVRVAWTGGMAVLPDDSDLSGLVDVELQYEVGSEWYQDQGGSWFLCSQETATIYAFADKRFTDAHSNYATRISNAFAAHASMFDDQTCITTDLQPVVAPGYNYSISTDCSTHLNAFIGFRPTYTGTDAYQLFTGTNLSGCNGIAKSPSTPGNMANERSSLVEAVDVCCDTYDPDETTTDLGLVSGHEIAHNWGEPSHPQDSLNGDYNIMATGTPYDWRDFWFTNWGSTESADRILSGTQGNL